MAAFNGILVALVLATAAAQAPTTLAVSTAYSVPLGTAGNFVILTKSGISTVPASDITGDIGVSDIAVSAIAATTVFLHYT